MEPQEQEGRRQGGGHWMNEPDIGSGDKSPAQRDIEREQRALGAERGTADQDGGDTLQSGDHIARIATRRMDDGMFEAQVFVRLGREPEIAETYIPAGTYSTEQEARSAARERAQRALDEREF
ncbi:MAG TPA: hypothetical protein VM406_04380 [Noviherbaspirillum sp.]|nr:hypothetical protein [Noviherbaspirillum sp.]